MKDEFGLTQDEWDQITDDLTRHDKEQRVKALRALWFRPVVGRVRPDGVVDHIACRDEDWTFWRAIKVSIAILANRQVKGERYQTSYQMAYWDAFKTYGGYTVDLVWLYPGFRYSIFNDGECLM